MDENRKKLYDQLSQNWNVGTWEEFDRDLDDENNQQVAWNAVGGQDGYGDFDLFKQSIQRSPQQEVVNQPVPQWEQQPTMQTDTPEETTTTTEVTPTIDAVETKVEENPKVDEPKVEVTDTEPTETAEKTEVTTEVETQPAGNQEPNFSSMSDKELLEFLGVGENFTQDDLDKSVTWAYQISDPVVREKRLTQMQEAFGVYARRKEAEKSAEDGSVIAKIPVKQEGVVTQEVADEISRGTNDNYNKLVVGDGKGNSAFNRAVSKPVMWGKFQHLIEEYRLRTVDDLQNIVMEACNNRYGDNPMFKNDEEAAIAAAAAVQELKAREDGGHAKTFGETELEKYYNTAYVEFDGVHDEQKQSKYLGDVRYHQEAYNKGWNGHATKSEDAESRTDCPVYAIPRMVLDLWQRELNNKRREREWHGGDPAAKSAVATADFLEATDFDKYLEQAIRVFGPEKLEGYILSWTNMYNVSIDQARQEVASMIRNNIIKGSGIAPSNDLEYVLGYVANNVFPSQIVKALYGVTHDVNPNSLNYTNIQQSTYQEYEKTKASSFSQMLAPTLTLVGDTFLGGFYFPSKMAKLAQVGFSNLLTAGTKETIKSLSRSAIWRIELGAISGSANFATYEAFQAATQQLATGSYKANFFERLNYLMKHGEKLPTFWGTVGEGSLSGGAKGLGFGTVGEFVGSLFSGASGITAYIGEGTKFLTEGGAFTLFGYLENGKVTWKDIGTNFGMALSGRVTHPSKYLKDLRARANNEGIYGKKANYHKISEEQYQKLYDMNYKLVADALIGHEIKESQLPALKKELDLIREDANVPWEVVRSADWVLNGKLSIPPRVHDYDVVPDDKGGYTITALDENKRAILGSVYAKNDKQKQAIVDRLEHEKEKTNWIESEAKMQESLSSQQVAESIREYAASKGEDFATLYKLYMNAAGKEGDGVKLGEVEREVYDAVNEIHKGKPVPTDVQDTKKSIGERYDVDVDEAINTPKDKRTQAQVNALNAYNEWLESRKDMVDMEQGNVATRKASDSLPAQPTGTETPVKAEPESTENKPKEEPQPQVEPENKTEEVVEPTDAETVQGDASAELKEFLKAGTIRIARNGNQMDLANDDRKPLEAKAAAKNMLVMFKSSKDINELHDRIWARGWTFTVNELSDVYKWFKTYKEGKISDKEVEALFDSAAREELLNEAGNENPEPPTDNTPPTGGGEPVVEGEGESEPLEVGASELPIVEAENLAGGKAVDTHDIEQLWPNDFGSLTEEDLPTYLEVAEESRKQAHDYAEGKTDVKPDQQYWEYWAERDKLVDPKAEVEQPPVEQPKQPTEAPVETPVETPVEQEPTAEQPVQPTEQEPSTTPTEAAPETTATVEPTPGAKPEVEATEQPNAEEQRRNAEEAARKRAQAADPYYMPMENKGGGRMSPDYDKASAEQIFNHLNDRENREQRGTLSADIEQRLKDAQARLASIEKQEPKGKKRTTSALNAWERRRDAAADRVEKWKEVKRMHDENQRTNGKSDLDDRQAREVFFATDPAEGGSLRDYVMRQLYGMKFKWKGTNYERSGGRTSGLGGHLGLEDSEKERRGFFGWLDEKNGMTPEEAAHSIWESMPQEWSDRYDTMEILDEVLSVVGDFPRPMDMVRDFAKNHRSMADEQADWDAGQMGYKDAAEAEADMEQQERDMASRHDAQAAENATNEETADSLAELQQIANDPNRSEFERQAARSALRWRQLPDAERKRRTPLIERVKKWTRKIGGDGVVVLHSVDEIQDTYTRRMVEQAHANGQRTPGWYDKGKVYIFMPDVTDRRDVDKTMVHEVVSHKGIKGLLGEAAYNDLLDAVYASMSIEAKDEYSHYIGGKENETEVEHHRRMADEWIANNLEGTRVDNKFAEAWNNIAKYVLDTLRGWGFDISNVTKTDLEHLLRQSYKNLRENADGGEGQGTASTYEGTDGGELTSESGARFRVRDDERREQTHSENFKKWFGDWENDPENSSKVVDKDGRPLVVYRGGEKINTFEKDRASKMAMYGQAFYATPSRYDAEGFARERTGDSGNVQAVYIDIRNPWVDSTCESMGYPKEASREQAKELIDLLKEKGLVDGEFILAKWEQGRVRSLLGALADAEYEGRARGRFERWHASDIVQDALKELGYDGVIGRFNSGEGMVDQVAAFEPTQIKSATENNGDFSRENPDIRYRLRDEERDREYADAVAAGDKKKVEKVVLDAVKEAMPNTKAIDRWGKPRLLFHGTPSENKFYQFADGMIFLSSSERNANEYTHYRRVLSTNPVQTGRVMPCFVNMENPLVIEGNRHLWNNIDVEWSDTPVDTRAVGEYAKAHGYDGVIIKKLRDNMYNDDYSYADVYIAFDTRQVKSAGPTYETRKRDHFPWDNYEDLADKIGATYDDNGELIPLSQRFDANNPDIRFRTKDDERKPTFYSNAERAVEGVKQEKATGEQWKAMLTKAGGIKAGEDKWMGLSQWLDDHKGEKLTKDEVLQFVRDNGVRMEEFGYTEHPKGFDDLKREYDQWLRTEGFDYAQEQLRERFGDDADIAFDDLGGELVISNEEAAAALLGSEQPINSTRLDYTTEGLENKREIAFLVPGVEPYQKNDAVHFGPENEGRAVMWVRFGETTDADGNRVLVIDEIQSNRHQNAREKGYKGHGSEYERLKQQAQNTQDAYFEQIEEYARTADGRLDRTKLNRAKEDDPLSKALWEQWSKDERALRQYNESHGFSESSAIPAAPFEKNWHEVAMKRMLRLAADEGFDKVAWTTGMQQAERYDLGKMVDEIRVIDASDGVHEVMGFKDGERVFDRDVAGGERGLSELIGKDMARKAYSNLHEGRTEYLVNGTYVSLTGKDLSIGGEGMKGFYDEILPRFMNKYGKRWGTQVGEVELNTPGHEVMHSVDVTDVMKESVQQGQPLFRVKLDKKAGDKVNVRETDDKKVRVDGLPGKWNDIDEAARAMRFADPEHVYIPSDDGKTLDVVDWTDNQVLTIWRGKPGSKRYEKWRERVLNHIHKQVPEYAKKLGLDVELIDNEADVPAGHENDKSWYDPETGKITIVVPRHGAFDTSDVFASLWHEGVAKEGLRKLVGEENYDNFLDNVYNTSDKDIKGEIERIAAEQYDGDNRAATQEYISRLAEQMGFEHYKDNKLAMADWMERGIKTVRDCFENLCKKLGIWDYVPTLRDDDLRAVLWNAHNKMEAENRNAYTEQKRAERLEEKAAKESADMGVVNIAAENVVDYTEERPSVADARRRLEDPNASEFEKQAARTVLRAYGGDDAPDGGDGGPRFRIKDDTEQLTGEVEYKNRQARQRKEAVADFVKATADLDEMTDSKFATALGKVMRGQREYDKDTVKDITDMAKAMMDAGLLSGLDDFAVKQILTKVKDATGKEGVTKEANKLIDIMLKHQLKKGKSEFEQSLKAKGMKQDSRGVVVQGGLDYHGQRMVKSLKEALGLSDLQAVNDRIVEVEQKLNDPDEVVRGNAADELDGLYIARQYFDEIKQNEINEANVKTQLEEAKTRHKNGNMSDAAYHQFVWSCEDALRELRCERVDAWSRLNGQLGDSKSESAERAKAFREEQNRRKEEIQHWVNSDLEGVDADPHAKSLKTRGQRRMDNIKHRLQILTNPLATFDKLMRFFGEKFPKGEGNLFNFVRKAVDARDSFFKKRKALYDEMDSAVERIGGLHGQKIDSWHDVYTLVKKLPTLTVNVKGKDYPISQGQATYLVAMDAQTDGRMKLRSMGITEADIDRIRGEIDPMLLDLSDWVVHEFLPSMRGELNQTHIRMFGADMSNIENYFPIRTNELARNETVNLAQQNGKIRPATITGSIIERKRNNADLDITTDFFQTTAEHVSEMEHWNSFAELSRDLNTLLSYKNFRAKVNNMSSLRYGDGKQIWDALEKCCAITTGDYIAEVGSGEKIVNAATRKMAQANIALRVYTAAKQLLSSPVYLVQARWDDIIKNIANPMGTWKWAIENLPTFAERWQGRVAGDPILTQSDLESSAAGYKYNKAKEGLARAGYFSNAAVDAMTVAIGGRSIYETKLRQYKDMGYSDEEANKRALQDAAISVNETQQSGIGTFLSPIQQDRTFWSRMVTLYRNASMGFQRELVGGLTAIKHGLSKTWREEAIRKASTKMIREGIDADVAQRVAERMANREAIRGVAWAAMFGSIAPAVWALGSQYFPYKLSGGSDEDEENEGLLHAAVHLFSGWMEGLVFGQTIGSAAEFGLDYARGKKKFRDFGIDMDLFSESFEQIGQKIDSKKAEAIYDLARMFVSMGVGVDPKTIVDPIVGIMDYFGNDYGAARDFGLLFMRLMNVPQSAVDKTYIDELQMTAGEAQKLPAEELARRWATYKRRKGAGPLNALTSDEYDAEIEDKYVERFEKMMDARLDLYDGARLDDAMQTTDPFVKKHLVKKITKDAGGTYRKPRSEKDAAYEQYQSKEGMEGDNELKGRLAQLEDYAAAIRKMGAKLKKTGANKGKWVWTDQKATDYYNAHKKELDAYAAISEFFTDLGAVKDSILTNPDEGKAWINGVDEQRSKILSETDWVK